MPTTYVAAPIETTPVAASEVITYSAPLTGGATASPISTTTAHAIAG